ncbi:MAG: hypothetical protein JST89_13345 [Cyanobacteria bacterium SZAS-4]|nr:hypothetical protein [Cyanobacteria bacterium SZAS-4]
MTESARQETTEVIPKPAAQSGNPLEQFGRAFAYSAIQTPISGIADTVDHLAGTHILPSVQFIDAPAPEKPFSVGWHAEQLGSALGMLVPYLATHKALGATGIEAFSAEKASTQMLLARSATSGFVLDGFLRPGDANAQGANYWLGRAGNGVIGAATFSAFTGASIGLKSIAGEFEGTTAAKLLRNNIVGGALSGIPIGAASAELHSRIDTGHGATLQQLGEGAYGMAFVGGALGGIGQLGENHSNEKTFSQSIDSLKTRASSFAETVNAKVAQFNPMIPQYSMAGIPDGFRAEGFRADVRSDANAMYSKAVKPADISSDTTGGTDKTTRSKSSSAPRVESFSIEKILGKGEDSDLADAYSILSRQHPEDFGGLKSSRPDAIANGQDSVAIELTEGKYKNAVLKIMGLPEADPEGRPYLDWDKDWGYRPYDAKILSDVQEITLPSNRTVFALVQEKVDALGTGGRDADMVQDASFANLSNEPRFDALMAQLAERGERFVDPGSRQLGYTKDGRLVLIDYPSVRATDTERPADLPEDIAEFKDEDKDPVERHEDHGFSVEDSTVATREDFLHHEPKNQAEALRQEISSNIFDGLGDRDIIPTIEWLYKDELAAQGISAKQAIANTRDYLRQNKLL